MRANISLLIISMLFAIACNTDSPLQVEAPTNTKNSEYDFVSMDFSLSKFIVSDQNNINSVFHIYHYIGEYDCDTISRIQKKYKFVKNRNQIGNDIYRKDTVSIDFTLDKEKKLLKEINISSITDMKSKSGYNTDIYTYEIQTIHVESLPYFIENQQLVAQIHNPEKLKISDVYKYFYYKKNWEDRYTFDRFSESSEFESDGSFHLLYDTSLEIILNIRD